MNIPKYLDLAAQVSRLKDDGRSYYHGAVGIRRDGVLVAASNGKPKLPDPKHHCEYRITRKLGWGGVIFLVRTKADGTWADSTPCVHCRRRLVAMGVNKIYFTVGDRTWESWDP